jgi:ubiquinone/menaquinone biosynthesis C-methylase UbiE
MPPDRKLSIARYQTYAKTYDRQQTRNAAVEQNRKRVVELLRLQRGDVVLDAGCGTGLNFALIEEAIGPEGTIIGIDQSPEMLAQAKERMTANGWQNVRLVDAPVENANLPAECDAMLFAFVHDILQSDEALEALFRHTKPGARVAAVGYKWAPWWALPWNYVIWNMTRRSVTTRENFGAPWRKLARFVPDLRIETAFGGAIYLASGTATASAK